MSTRPLVVPSTWAEAPPHSAASASTPRSPPIRALVVHYETGVGPPSDRRVAFFQQGYQVDLLQATDGRPFVRLPARRAP